jgi:hypothetical protein
MHRRCAGFFHSARREFFFERHGIGDDSRAGSTDQAHAQNGPEPVPVMVPHILTYELPRVPDVRRPQRSGIHHAERAVEGVGVDDERAQGLQTAKRSRQG